ncbi:MAG: hypothetical protein LBT55_03290 [Clostridiaceae bacterium]|jgi:hypothetical protein|nr:hypothetical protein [Clostridiaceae bacterium]
MEKAKKLLRFVIPAILVITLVVVFSVLITTYKQTADTPNNGADTETQEKIKPTDVLDKILEGVRLGAVPENGYSFNIDAAAAFALTGKDGSKSSLNFKINITLDVDPSTATADNLYVVELTSTKNGIETPLFNLYYKDSLTETPYIYAGVGNEKHAVKFTSVKKLVQNGVPGLTGAGASADGTDGKWSTESILALLNLGGLQGAANVIINNFALNGSNSIIKNPYISESGAEAGFEINMDNVKALIGIATELIGGIDGLDGIEAQVDGIFNAIGVDLSFVRLKDIINNLPETEIGVKAVFNANGALASLDAGMKFVNDVDIVIDATDGSRIAEYKIPGGTTVSFVLSKLAVSAGAPLFTEFPEGFDENEYPKHNLINFEFNGTARVEAIREIDQDGNEVWQPRPAYDYFVKADLDPFVLLNGIDPANLENNIKAMGRFHIYAWATGTSNSKVEIVFDPEHTGTDNLLAQFKLSSFAELASDQYLSFDISDLIYYIAGTPSSAGTAAASADETSGAVGIINGIKGIMDMIGLEYEKTEDGFAISLFPRNVDLISSFQNELMTDWGERLHISFESFTYGTLSPDYDAYAPLAATKYYPYEVTNVGVPEANKLLTEYEYGQKFQNGYTTIDMLVTYRSATSSYANQQKSCKVIKLEGFDSLTPGEKEVTVYFIIPPRSGQMGVYDVFANGNLPYGIRKLTYTIKVAPPEDTSTYALVSDGIKAGESIFDKNIKINGTATVFKIASFKLYTDKDGDLSNAINTKGVARTAGKYWLEAVAENGAAVEQYIYINNIYIPDFSEKLVRGAPVLDLYGYTQYYDTATGTVKTETIVPTTIQTNDFLKFVNDVIVGNGFTPTELQKPNVGLKYTYNYAEDGQVKTYTATFSGLRVIVKDVLEWQASFSSSTANEGGYVNAGTWIHRADADGTLYSANLQYGSGLKFVGGKYQIWDVYGNVIADEVVVKIWKGSSATDVNAVDVTDEYYDAVTGRYKIRTDENGHPILIGLNVNKSADGKNLYIELTAKYGYLKASQRGSISFNPAVGRFIPTTSASHLKPFAQIYYTYAQFSFYNPASTEYAGTEYLSFDYVANKYYVKCLGRKIYAEIKLFKHDGETVVEVENAFDKNGCLTVCEANNGTYHLNFKFDFDGIVFVYDTVNFTIYGTSTTGSNGRTSYMSANSTISSSGLSLGYFHTAGTGAYSSAYLKVTENGFVIDHTTKGIPVELKFYDLDGNPLEADSVIDGDGKAVGAKGKYIMSISFTVVIDGVEVEIELKEIFEIT